MATAKSKKLTMQAIRGMHDILPSDQPHWSYFHNKSRDILEEYGFERIDVPVLENTGLFVRTVGESTDIVEKEIYNFKTKGGDEVAMRPEFTAGIVRAYIEHGMSVMPHPIQLWAIGPVFRHDNPQAGRLRQFHQLDAEMFGDESSAADAQMIFVAYKLLESLGIKGLSLRINSIGDQNCRPQYIKTLKEYYQHRNKKICAKCQGRLKTNILRVLDCNEEHCKEIAKEAPQIFDYLDSDCKKHLKGVLEFLDEAKVPYLLDHTLVRGLDYYTRTVFEIWPEEKEGSNNSSFALCAGGRYDRLVNFLGGPKTPATGWAMGIERVILILKELNAHVPAISPKPKIFIAQLGDMAKKKSLVMFEEFRKAGIPAKASFGRDSVKSQMRIANRLGIKYTLIIGQKEALEGSVILREMDSGVQETIPAERIVESVKQRLRRHD